MPASWPALCVLIALAVLLWLIIRRRWHPFLALMLVSLGLGLAAGMSPPAVVDSFSRGVGDILRSVAVLLALGAILGRLLEVSGIATVIAQTLVDRLGIQRAPLAILLAGFLIGLPVLFNVGFLLLLPIVWRLQKQTGESLLFYLLPLAFSLGMTHSLVPPHPGIVGAVNILAGPGAGAVMVQAILFGSLLTLPLILLGWYGPGRAWARRQFVACPPMASSPSSAQHPEDAADGAETHPSFAFSVFVVTLPLLLSVLGFGARLLSDLGHLPDWLAESPWEGEDWRLHPPVAWLEFLGKPTIALLTPTLLALAYLVRRRGFSAGRLSGLAEEALRDVGSMVFLFGAAGGFKEMILATDAGRILASGLLTLPLSPLAIAYVVAVLMRIALGSATASILTASALLTGLAADYQGPLVLMVLAVANGVTFMTQPADSGFWMLKGYGNLSVRDVLIGFNACRIVMSVGGILVLLLAEMLLV